MVFYKVPIKIHDPKVAIVFTIFLLGFYISFINGQGIDLVPARILPFITIGLFILMPIQLQKRIFIKFTKLYVFFLIPSIFYWVMNLFHIDLSYTTLEPDSIIKANVGVYYKQFFLAVENVTGTVENITRLSGIFDEPGVVGTISGLLLGANKFDFKNNWMNKVIFVSGILSFSIAFYVLCIIFIVVNSVKLSNLKSLITVFSLILLYSLMISIEFENEFFDSLQSRLIIEDGSWVANNRTTELFNTEFNSFLESGGPKVWFGNGIYTASKNEFLAGGSSYKMIIFDSGVIGFTLIIMWLLFASLGLRKSYKSKDFYTLLLIALFMASIYQRPYVFTYAHSVIIFGGIANLVSNSKQRGKVVNV
jgi:hypothetical protein